MELEVGRLLTRVMLVGGYLFVPVKLGVVPFPAQLMFVGSHSLDWGWCPHFVVSHRFPPVGLLLWLCLSGPLGCMLFVVCFVVPACPPLVAIGVGRARC